MKIGILIKDFQDLSNWELRIICEILRDPSLDLALLIKDGRDSNPISLREIARRLSRSKNLLGRMLLKVQAAVEFKVFTTTATVDREKMASKLSSIPTLNLHPKSKGYLDIFGDEDANMVKQFDLDIILRHAFGIIRGPILRSSRYGIWSFHHGDNAINRGGPPGFWEVVLRQPTVGVTLQRLTEELDGGYVIDKAYFNRHWSYVETQRLVFESSVSLLMKNLKKLQEGRYNLVQSTVYYNPLYRAPTVSIALAYSIKFYLKLLKKAVERLDTKLFGSKYRCWTIFIGSGDFLTSTLFRLKPVELPKNEFWADPFLYQHSGDTYVFFENYSYKSKLGKISCGRVDRNQLVEVVDVLELDYHLSYPQVIQEDGNLYLMPESMENNRLEIYRCVQFPNEWELYSTAFEGERVADATYFQDDDGERWLFINKQADINVPVDNELHIYQIDSLKLGQLIPHAQNPVLIDSRKARNAGGIFRRGETIYRPSQANIDGIYGRALNISEIETLTIDEYNEKSLVTTYANFRKGLVAMHHLHQLDNCFVIDAAYGSRW